MQQANVVNLVGGLGNQLFQYVFGQLLERHTRQPTRYDTRDFKRYKLHEGLAIERYFDVRLPVATAEDFDRLPLLVRSATGKKVSARLSRTFGNALPLWTDYNFDFNRIQQGRHSTAYFHGYWQSQNYADDIASLRQELGFRAEIRERADVTAERLGIDFDNAVAVHIRRGDYLRLKNACHLPLPEAEYYLPLMKQAGQQRPGTTFFVFSDEIEALRDGPLSTLPSIFVGTAASPSPGVDMCLMSRFRSLILSASSFSWWAAAFASPTAPEVTYPHPWVKRAYLSDTTLSPSPLPGWRAADTLQIRSY